MERDLDGGVKGQWPLREDASQDPKLEKKNDNTTSHAVQLRTVLRSTSPASITSNSKGIPYAFHLLLLCIYKVCIS